VCLFHCGSFLFQSVGQLVSSGIISLLCSSYLMCHLLRLRAVTVRIGVLWDVTPYILLERY
jgi:hypothetical protein